MLCFVPVFVCLFVSSYSQGAEYWINSDPQLPSKLENLKLYKYNITIISIYIYLSLISYVYEFGSGRGKCRKSPVISS